MLGINWLSLWHRLFPAKSVDGSEFKIKEGGVHPDQVQHSDPVARELIARCFNEGKMFMANRDENGKVTIKSK